MEGDLRRAAGGASAREREVEATRVLNNKSVRRMCVGASVSLAWAPRRGVMRSRAACVCVCAHVRARPRWRAMIEVYAALDNAAASALGAARVGDEPTLGAMRSLRAQVLVARCLEEWATFVEYRRASREDYISTHAYGWMYGAARVHRFRALSHARARAGRARVTPSGSATRRARTAGRRLCCWRNSAARASSSRSPRRIG